MKQYLSNPITVFYVVMGLSLLLIFLPKIGAFFRVFNTFIHESGHAVVALITSGTVCNIKLNSNTSGQATTTSKYWLSKVLVSLAGYSLCALAAYGLFYLIKDQKYVYIYWGFIGVASINLIFWVRNTFGIVWLLVFIALNGILIYHKIAWLDGPITLFFTFTLFFANMYSSLVLLKISIQEPKNSGDVTNLAAYTHLPAVVWALLLNGFVGYFGYLTIIHFFPNPF